MGLKKFKIEFNHPGPSLFASQTLSGKVILELNQDKVINYLEILCCGKGKVHWKETKNGSSTCGAGAVLLNKKFLIKYPNKKCENEQDENRRNNPEGTSQLNSQTIMSVEENYIEEKILLLEKKNSDKLLVEKGTSEYPFEFRIPPTSPSSFQGPYGHIKYYLEARLARSKRKCTHVIRIPFTVNGLLDLNKDPRQMSPRTPSLDNFVNELKKFTKINTNFLGCFICWIKKTGITLNQVGFHLRLHKSLFVPGEYIQFVADMRNFSGTDVSGVTLSLIQETNYYVGDKCRSGLKHTVATTKGPSVTSGQQEIWETNPIDSLFLQIPSVPPTNLATSKIIEIKYFLQLEMEFYGQKNIKGQLPILIGSIPLKNTFRDFVNLRKRNEPVEIISEYNGVVVPKKSFGLSMGYADLPSPTFEEAVCFTPSLDLSSFMIGNGFKNNTSKPYVEQIQVKSISNDENEDNGDEGDSMNSLNYLVDSDDEYLNTTDTNLEKYDDKYVPLYAKYTTTYAFDG